MIARIARLAAIALIAAVVTLVQLDQQSLRSPAAAFMVPAPVSANAARERARLALQVGGVSLADARRALVARPLPAESLTVFSLSALGAGENALGVAALEAASTRGWREPISQLASGEAALAQGEHAVAVQRVVALLSTGDLAAPALDLLARLLAVPEGREAFAERMAQHGRWQGNRLPEMAGTVDLTDLAATLVLARARGAQLPCDRLALLVPTYRSAGRDAELASFWPEDCPPI